MLEESVPTLSMNSNGEDLKNSEEDMHNSSWTEKDVKEDFQSIAKKHSAKLKDESQINEAAKLHYEELMVREDKCAPQIDFVEVAEQAESWN